MDLEKLQSLCERLDPFQPGLILADEEIKETLRQFNLLKFAEDPFELTKEILKILEKNNYLN